MNRSFFLTRLFQRKAYWLVPGALLLLLGTLIGDAQARPEAQWVYDHHFIVDATSDEIYGFNWTPETTVQVTIDDVDTPAEPDYSASTQVGACRPEESTFFCLALEDLFDIRPGLVIDVTDYITTTKTTVVTTLLVYGMNAEEDTVWGIADPGIDVSVMINSWLMKVTPDQDGYWLADFTGLYDIQLMDGGDAFQSDEDGDSTKDLFIYPSFIYGPYAANCGSDEGLAGYSWLPYQQIDFQVDDPSTGEINPDFSLSVFADEDGQFAIAWDGEPDIQPGFTITATDGYMTKVHTVTHLDTLGANAEQDTVWGIADPGITVTVSLGPASMQVMPDQDGSWMADFTGIYDAQPGEGGNSSQVDDDRDTTNDTWHVPDSSFIAEPQEERIYGSDWLTESQVTIQIDDPTNGTGIDFTTSTMTNESGNFTIELGNVFDIQPGLTVTVTDGNMTKEHTVTDLNILGIDIEDDTIWGTADPGITIGVYVWTAPYSLDVQADENGDWIADFTDLYDLGIGDCGDSVQHDNDGDGTAIRWNIPMPTILADWKKDRVEGGWWTPGSTIQVSIYSTPGDTSPVFTTSVPVVAWDESLDWFELNLSGYFDLQPGQWIEATDGRTTKSMTVSRVQHTIVNDVYDTVSGIAEPGFAVYISCNGEFTEGGAFRIIEPASDGTWTADFANPAPEDSRVYDLPSDLLCTANQTDSDGDRTSFHGGVQYTINVYVGSQEIELNWPWEFYEIPVIVTIDDPDNGAGIDFSTTALNSNISSEQLQGYVIQPGDLITATDGVATKQTIVTGLAITSVDVINDQVSGTAAPGSLVGVDTEDNLGSLQLTTGPDGTWVADFSGIYDIVYGIYGNARQADDDRDTTNAQWRAPQCPPGDSISGHVWLEDGVTPAPNGMVIIEAYDQPYVTLYSVSTNEDGSYACGLPDGTYRLYAEADAYSREYYAETIFENATPVQVVVGSPQSGIDFTLDTPGYVFDHMTFNFNEPIIAQLPVRQAIFFGTDRQRILDATYPASPYLDSVIITPHWAHTSAALLQYNYDPEMARRVLEQAGWVDSDGDGIREKDGVRLHLKYLTTDLAMRQVIAAIFQENMLAIGIEIEVIIHLSVSEWFTLYPDLSIAQFAWSWVDINNDDPHSMIFYLTEWSNHNRGSYSNPAADQLLHLASLFGTRAEMLPYLEHYQRVVMADPPMMLLLLRIDPLPDQDGDGVPDADDLCPDVSSQGYDADQDGCLDTTQGLTALVNQLYTDGEISSRSTRNTLLNQVVKVEGLLADGSYTRAITELDKFITLVNNGLTNGTLTQTAADQLVAYAESLKRWVNETYLAGMVTPPEISLTPGFYR